MNGKRLGDMLRESRLIDDDALRAALEVQRGTGERLGSTLLRLGLVDSASLARLLGDQLGVESVDPGTVRPEAEALALLSFTDAMRLGCLPIGLHEGTLTVAMTEPHQDHARAQVEAAVGHPIRALVAPQMALYEALKRFYRDRSTDDERADRIRRVARELRSLAEELEGLLASFDLR